MQENEHENGDGIDYSQLHVYAGPEQPSLSDMTVYASGKGEIFSHPVQANVIGSSHYISVAGMGYREITSCRPISMELGFHPVTRHYIIDGSGYVPQPSDSFTRHTRSGHLATVTISAEAHNPRKVENSDWDVFYTFEGDGPAAPTGIRLFNDGWSTVHAYPEFNVDLYTRTRFKPRG